MTSISGGPVVLESDGANSVINLSVLQTFTSSRRRYLQQWRLD